LRDTYELKRNDDRRELTWEGGWTTEGKEREKDCLARLQTNKRDRGGKRRTYTPFVVMAEKKG